MTMMCGFAGARMIYDFLLTWVGSTKLPFYGPRYEILHSMGGYNAENFGDFRRIGNEDEANYIKDLRNLMDTDTSPSMHNRKDDLD